MIKIIKNINELEKIRECWDVLYKEDDNCTPFQSFDYNYISWKRFHQGYSLFVLLFYQNQEKSLSAIFPFCIDSKNCLRFINEDHSDFQTAIVKNLAKTDLKMYEELFVFIKDQPYIHRICLNHLRHDDLLLHYLGHVSVYARLYGTESYSYLRIESSHDDMNFIDSLRHLTAKERNRLKNIEKKADGLTFKLISKADTEYPEQEVKMLVQEMIDKGIRSEAYFTDNLIGFLKDLYQAGVLKMALVYREKELGSVSFFYQGKNSLSIQWIIIYSDKKYNLQAKLKLINNVFEDGGGIFNFGRGTYKYKIQHFRPVIQNLFCVDIPFRRKARMMLMFESLKDLMKKIFYNFKKKLRIGSR